MAERSFIAGPRSVAVAALLAVSVLLALLALALAPASASAAPPANDSFANATALAATLPANESGSLAEATLESGEPDHVDLGGPHTVWYRWQPAVDTTVAVDTCGSPDYAGVAVYGHGPVSSPGPRLGTESGCLNGTSTIVHATAGSDYWIAVQNVTIGGAAGDYVLKLQVAGSIEGRVLDESSQPVADHCVRVLDPASGTAAVTAHTGADGRWSVELPPAGYQVRFEGCSSGGSYAFEYWQNAADVDAAATIALAPGQARTGIDAQLEPAASIAGDLTRPAGGGGVANACVTAFDPDHPGVEVASTTTDSSGHYRITNLSAASYKLLFQPGCSTATDLKDEYYNDKGTFATADAVTLTAGQSRTGISAVLGDGGSIGGTVRNAALAGIEDICVSAAPVGGGPDEGTQTGPAGSYTITGLDPGSYVVRFSDCNTSSYATEYYDDSPDAAGADPVAVAREQDVTSVDATLQQNGSIAGRVRDAGSDPLDAICVVALDAAGNEIAGDATDGNGDYEIVGLSPGSYRVHFVDCSSGAFVDEYFADATDFAGADPVTVLAGQSTPNIDAELASAGAITGTVTGPGGAPADGICVSALSLDGVELGLGGTDASGVYLITHLSPGSYKLVFRDCNDTGLATEFYNDSATFTGATPVTVVEGAQEEGKDAQLTAGGSISGEVTAEGVDPAADVCISAFPTADAVYPAATTSSGTDGTYTLSGLRSGSYKVYFDGSCSLDQLSEEFYDDVSTFPSGTPVSVSAPSDHAGIDADLTATQAPTVTITSGPTGATADATPTFGFSRTGGGAVECSIDTGTANFGPCSNAAAHTPASNLSDGAYTFRVRVSNAAGEQTATRTFSVDTQPPSISISSPGGPTNVVRPTFAFSAEAGSSVQCSIDTGTAGYGPCSAAAQHQPSSDLAQGAYTFRVRATDAVGNSAVATRTFSVDTTAPTLAFTGPTIGFTNDPTPTFTFDPEAGASVQCSLDAGTANYGACSGPGNSHTPAANLTDGVMSMRVRATDAAGNVRTIVQDFTVDTVAPDTTITVGPTEGGTITTAGTQFSFASSEPTGATFECKLDSGSFSSCSSPRNLNSLSNGPHTFQVRTTDRAANADATPATRTFTVDTTDHTPPETTITSGPAEGSTVVTASTGFGFSADEAGSTFECKLDSGSFASCTAPRTLSGLTNGSHTFQVQATDPNGNTDPTPASRTFTVAIDSTPPDTVIDSGPSGTIAVSSGTFTFHATEAGSTFECKLDGGAFSSCPSPLALSGLAGGAHIFSVRAIDAAGNADPSPATQQFTVSIPSTPPPTTPDPPDTSGCDSAQSKLESAQAAMTKAKAKLKKAKSKSAKKKAKAAVKNAKKAVAGATAAVASAC